MTQQNGIGGQGGHARNDHLTPSSKGHDALDQLDSVLSSMFKMLSIDVEPHMED